MACVSSPRSEIVRSAGRLSFPQTPPNTRHARRVPEAGLTDFPRTAPDPPLTPKPAPAGFRNPRCAGPRGWSLDAAQGPISPTLRPPARVQYRPSTGVFFLGNPSNRPFPGIWSAGASRSRDTGSTTVLESLQHGEDFVLGRDSDKPDPSKGPTRVGLQERARKDASSGGDTVRSDFTRCSRTRTVAAASSLPMMAPKAQGRAAAQYFSRSLRLWRT